MPSTPRPALTLSRPGARQMWLRAQRLDRVAPFGTGPDATLAAVAHLGYVQIDTINVIERCHHHILWNRIPDYRPAHLGHAQSHAKSVFEYWTHALSYVPAADFRLFRPAMAAHRREPRFWFGSVAAQDYRKVLARIRDNGPLTIRDIGDDVLVDKDHPWASRKPSKRALQLGFFTGDLVISARSGMLKTYELTARHFGWEAPPRAAGARQVLAYRLDRALRAQGVVSLDSVCYLEPRHKPALAELIAARVEARRLRPITIEGVAAAHWAEPAGLEADGREEAEAPVHILSPFDPLVIQRKRAAALLGYAHRFEAYLPRDKRLHGYFALPVLVDGTIAAAIDIKADRAAGALLIQQWTWTSPQGSETKRRIEEALGRFERFQFGSPEEAGAATVTP